MKNQKKGGKGAGKDDAENGGEIGIPQNEVQLKLNFELKHEAGHYIKIKYDWI